MFPITLICVHLKYILQILRTGSQQTFLTNFRYYVLMKCENHQKIGSIISKNLSSNQYWLMKIIKLSNSKQYQCLIIKGESKISAINRIVTRNLKQRQTWFTHNQTSDNRQNTDHWLMRYFSDVFNLADNILK